MPYIGRPLFHSNTIEVHIEHSDPRHKEALQILGIPDDPDGYELLPDLTCMSRMRIVLHSRLRGFAHCDNRADLRGQIRDLTKVLAGQPNWTQLTIELVGEDYLASHPMNDGQSLSVDALDPLKFLRGRQHVESINVDEQIRHKLSTQLTLPGPSYLLQDMFDNLKVYFEAVAGMRNFQPRGAEVDFVESLRDRLENGVEAALLAEDAARFIRQRAYLIRGLDLLHRYQTGAVFRADPDAKVGLRYHPQNVARNIASVVDMDRNEDLEQEIGRDLAALEEMPFD